MSKIFYSPSNTDYTDTHTYYNANMVNSSDTPIIANYSDNRDEELISDPEHWHLSIERADIDALYIPLFHFITGAYKVSLNYGVISSSQNVIYVPESTLTPQDSLKPVYSINHFLKMVNDALLLAFDAIKASIPAINRPAYPPGFVYNSTTKLFSLIAETTYDTVTPPSGIAIFIGINTRLFNMLSGGWDVKYYGTAGPALDYNFNIYNQKNNIITLSDPAGVIPTKFAYDMKAEYVSSNLKDATKLILTTSMPIAREYIPALEGNATTGSNSTQAILTDFSIGSQPEDVGRPGYLYIPQYPRNIDLVGNIPIRNITMAVFWQDRAGALYPVYIPPHSSFTIKMSFKRKTNISR